MTDKKALFDWQGALQETYQEFINQVFQHLPQVIAAVLLLLVGWLAARLLRVLARKMILALPAMLPSSIGKRDSLHTQILSYARWGGNIVFWAVFLFFGAASANLLQWDFFSGLSSALLSYLPNLLTGLLIILAGFACSGLIRTATISAANSAGVEKAEILGTTAQLTVILTSVVIGVQQLGINVDFLTTTLIVMAGVLSAGFSLAFGLGAREYVANIIGVQAARKHFQIGQHLHIAGVDGELLEITPTALVLDTEKGRATVPGKLFNDHVCEMVSESQTASGGSLLKSLFQKKEAALKEDIASKDEPPGSINDEHKAGD
ncbi:mechanosensitive ion channel family protein [Alkalimarinus alittae]|uniref:Small-conductance mechanosensitive channel n=1 Tax=Alkalimarinus alittae TaxID=2961619 RepID=A0ABY6MZX5_9ALTE|nr:mechanosensitive ion channel domain-containing protein [Alkalimarinus alittae]UZE95405.1 mechanosensitive ion channel [Alkalimarinus alittae]